MYLPLRSVSFYLKVSNCEENMTIYDIIQKKKRAGELSESEIRYFVDGYTKGVIPDYQISALLMAICLKGMSDGEIFHLTDAIAKSGDMLDLSEFGTLSVDKHSSGGVGDKTTLIVSPIAASLGCKVAKMSGRGLGHTGGTVDKLETFSGYRLNPTQEEFIDQVRRIGVSVIAQSGELAPADKKIYALRDVTATVDSIPLIASSIMSKKIAAGAHSIVLDVKCGSGSFMKTPKDAECIAEKMVEIGERFGRSVSALITDMDTPLGRAIGNALEVSEAYDVLAGKGPRDLYDICVALSGEMVKLSLGISESEAERLVTDAIKSGKALKKFNEWISAQGGDISSLSSGVNFHPAKYSYKLTAKESGYIYSMNAEQIGLCALELGAGRKTKDSEIDLSAGIILEKKTGDKVSLGETVATFYSSSSDLFGSVSERFLSAIKISDTPPVKKPLIYKKITSGK